LRAGLAPLRARLAIADVAALDAALGRWADGDADDVPATALVHRDVAPGHVLYDPAAGRLTGVIDFGDLALGDPARDLIYVDEDFGPDLLDAVLRHYAPGDDAALRRRMRRWQLLELVGWTLDRLARRRAAESAYGVAEVPRALAAADG
ncbi:phosphotransferase, partial [Roseisolibacter sp. H3M3-2]|uniref:phosphotransferase n=1 Tax=Roseisolibacter sp. H3M3-2 TaxID=3031323 RepID=UPI0023DB9311